MRRLLLSLPLLLWAATGHAQLAVYSTQLHPAGFCQFTAGSAATLGTSCTGGVPGKAILALITIEVQNVRWRDDGTAPTTTVGMLVSSGTTFSYQGDLTAIQFIAVTGSPVVDVSFYGIR